MSVVLFGYSPLDLWAHNLLLGYGSSTGVTELNSRTLSLSVKELVI